MTINIDKIPLPTERRYTQDEAKELYMSGFYYKSLLNVGKCISRNNVAREYHSFDKDGNCIFCEVKNGL